MQVINLKLLVLVLVLGTSAGLGQCCEARVTVCHSPVNLRLRDHKEREFSDLYFNLANWDPQ
eukprot:3089912-Rhodomonas_salina.1